MPSSLPISRLVNVSVNLSPQAAQMQNINNLLILGSSSVIDTVSRKRDYNTINDVATDFGTTASEYLAAALWFAQAPQPSVLSIGRWAKTDTHARLVGAPLNAAGQQMAVWTQYTTPGFLIFMNGIPYAIAPASFAAATNLNAVASAIQTALAASVALSTCVWDPIYARFVIENGTTGATSTINFEQASAAVGNAAFSGQPTNLDTLTLSGTVITFVTGTPAANQVQIGATLAATLTSLAALINSSVDIQVAKFKAYVNPANTAVYLTAVATGVAGNALTIAKSSTAITVSAGTLTGATAQDISAALSATSTSSGAYLAQGMAAETALAAVLAFDNQFGQAWYALTICGAVDSDHLAVAGYIEAASNKHIYGVSTQSAAILTANDTTNIAYQLQQLKYNRTIVQYSSTNLYAANSYLGRILTVNYNGNNTTITLMYKQEPGITAEYLTSTQLNALTSYNCNVFVAYNNSTAIVQNGVMASGSYTDEITGTDWLALSIQTQVYNLLYTSPTKIPQTDAGNNIIATTMESVLLQGRADGLLAPGIWNAAGFGNLTQGDFLDKGYYIYTPPIATQVQADRGARKSVTFQIAAKLAGAIHTVNTIINVNR